MTPSATPYPTRQERSRRSQARFLDAAAKVLDKHGLDGATIPRIAASAGLSPANIYRRFPDKNALLRATFLRFYEQVYESTGERLDPARVAAVPLDVLATNIFHGLAEMYRQRPNFFRALFQFMQGDTNPSFRRRITQFQRITVDRFVDLFLQRRAEIAHPDPESALRFAVLFAMFTLREMILAPGATRVAELLHPLTTDSIEREITAAFLRYLRVKEPALRVIS